MRYLDCGVHADEKLIREFGWEYLPLFRIRRSKCSRIVQADSDIVLHGYL